MIELFTTPLGLLKVYVVLCYSISAIAFIFLPFAIVQKHVALKTGAQPTWCIIDSKHLGPIGGWGLFTTLAFYWLVLDKIAPPHPWLLAAWLLIPTGYTLKLGIKAATHKCHPLDLPRK